MAKHKTAAAPAERIRKRTMSEVFVASVIQDNGHFATTDIIRKRHVTECELQAIIDEMAELQLRIVQAKARRKRAELTLIGLEQVIAVR